jgi:hypothetical protein
MARAAVLPVRESGPSARQTSLPIDHLPLFADLSGKFFNGPFLFRLRISMSLACRPVIMWATPKVPAGLAQTARLGFRN